MSVGEKNYQKVLEELRRPHTAGVVEDATVVDTQRLIIVELRKQIATLEATIATLEATVAMCQQFVSAVRRA